MQLLNLLDNQIKKNSARGKSSCVSTFHPCSCIPLLQTKFEFGALRVVTSKCSQRVHVCIHTKANHLTRLARGVWAAAACDWLVGLLIRPHLAKGSRDLSSLKNQSQFPELPQISPDVCRRDETPARKFSQSKSPGDTPTPRVHKSGPAWGANSVSCTALQISGKIRSTYLWSIASWDVSFFFS